MDSSHLTRISVTPTVPRQTPKNEFGQVLSNTVNGVMTAGTALLGSLPGMPIISSAVSAVSALANSGRSASSAAASGIVPLNQGAANPGVVGAGTGYGSTVTGGTSRAAVSGGVEPSGMTDMISSMRAEADRSMMMQMQMQTESREYNALTNILKLRHDSAKAAINNIR